MLHYETVEPNTLGLLKGLMDKPYLDRFVLVGGTALALQIGHRLSVDLDLFTNDPFDSENLLQLLERDFDFKLRVQTPGTLIGQIDGIKVDLIRFRYPFLHPVYLVDEIRMANIADIIPMKLDAMSARGAKKDFFDIYFLLQRFTLPEMLDLHSKLYQHSSLFHVIKSLTWFEDAEPHTDPILINKNVNWSQMKRTIEKAVAQLKY